MDRIQKNRAMELLAAKLPASTASKLFVILKQAPDAFKSSQLERFYDCRLVDEITVALTILQDRDREYRFNRWTQATALFCASSSFYPNMMRPFLPYLLSSEKLLSQAAFYTINQFCHEQLFTLPELLEDLPEPAVVPEIMKKAKEFDETSLLEIEKIIILKSTSLFTETPENILADIAKILKEERVSEGEIIFRKDDTGNCMYIIYEGMVKIHIGNYRLNTLINRDFFGELGLLDTNPRSATATADKDTLLLRLDQDAFYDLMAHRPEVARGIVQVLCNRIRTQDSLITDLQRKLS